MRPETAAETTEFTNTDAGLEYRKVNREVRKKMTAAKEEWTEEQCKNIEKGIMSGNRKEAHDAPRSLTKSQQHKSAVMEDSSRSILMESTTTLSRWTEYYSELSDYQLRLDNNLLQSNQTPNKRLKTYLC